MITGSGFLSGSWPTSAVTFSVGGITVNSVTRTDSSHLTVNVSVSGTAPVGQQAVAVRNLDAGRATKANGFAVTAGPAITSLGTTALPQGASSKVINVNGSNFASGSWPASAVTFSGSGVTVNSVAFVNPGQLKVTVSISSSAATGARTIAVRNPTDGGKGSLVNGFTVNAKPAISSISPSSKARGSSNVVVTINGSGFQAGATVAFTGNGITIVVRSNS